MAPVCWASVENSNLRPGLFFILLHPIRELTQAAFNVHAERNHCHDTLSFRASTFGRGSFLLMIAKLPELLSRRLRLQGH